jgi:molybdopterin-guanine dinucleotide biosynthesis protein A
MNEESRAIPIWNRVSQEWASDSAPATLASVVLCGGESRRMGRSKAWLPFGPERMLPRVVRLVGSVGRSIVVVAAPDQELPELAADILVVRDPITGRGPLQGLAAGFAALADPVDLVYATATDVPFLEPRWIIRLAELIGDHDLAIPFIGEYYHPLAALYRKDAVLPVIEDLLSKDRLRASLIVDAVKTRVVHEAEMRAVDPELGTLRNLNNPTAYQAALRDAGLSHD